MTPAALYSGARMAIKLARECERDAELYDLEWFRHMQSEAKRHRERAAGYLKSRCLLIERERIVERMAA